MDIKIGRVRSDGWRRIRVGDHVAYALIARSGTRFVFQVQYAETKADRDAVAAALVAASPAQIRRALRRTVPA